MEIFILKSLSEILLEFQNKNFQWKKALETLKICFSSFHKMTAL